MYRNSMQQKIVLTSIYSSQQHTDWITIIPTIKKSKKKWKKKNDKLMRNILCYHHPVKRQENRMKYSYNRYIKWIKNVQKILHYKKSSNSFETKENDHWIYNLLFSCIQKYPLSRATFLINTSYFID